MHNEIKSYIEKVSQSLELTTSISIADAEKRASLFLTAQAKLADWKHLLGEGQIKAQSVLNAVYAQELSKGTSKTMTENKVTAEASKEFRAAREEFELITNDISYLRTYMDIYSAAHVFYRNMCKDIM